jgi:hypothetical protein
MRRGMRPFGRGKSSATKLFRSKKVGGEIVVDTSCRLKNINSMVVLAEKSIGRGKDILLTSYAGSYKEIRTIISFANASLYSTPSALCQQFALYFGRMGWSGSGSRFSKPGIVVNLLLGMNLVVKEINPAPVVRVIIAPAASHDEPRPVQGMDFANVRPADKTPTLIIGVQAGSGLDLPEAIKMAAAEKPPRSIPTDVCIVVLYDGKELGNEEPSIKAKIAAEKQKSPNYKPPHRATGADMATVANATTRFAYDVTDAKSAIDKMRKAGLEGMIDYIIILYHGVRDENDPFAKTTQQWGDEAKVFTSKDAKALAPYLRPFGSFVLAGCHAGEDTNALKAIAAASNRTVWANPSTDTTIRKNQSFMATSASLGNRWKPIQPKH